MLNFLKNFSFLKGHDLLKKANSLWSFFSSVKLTLVLLFLMVVLFVVATLIPQQSVSPEFAWLSDIYHSRVFYILMALFSLNLMICSLNRLPLTIRQYRAPHFPPPSGLFENLPQNRTIQTHEKMEDVEQMVEASLSSKISNVQKTNSEKGHLFYRGRGRFSLFGVYMAHLGVLVIIAGAVVGSIWGFQAEIRLSEGQESNVVQLAKSGAEHQLDFDVRCEKFVVEFYDTGAPKTYRSDLSFSREGRVVHQGSVSVNHPLSFNGLRFYQANYGVSEDSRAYLRYENTDRENREISVSPGEIFDLPDQKAKATVLRVEEDIMQLGPAVKLRIETDKGKVEFWVFQHIKEIAEVNPGLFSAVPVFNPGLFQPLVFSLQRVENQFFTGLQIVRDPGVPFVLTGGIMLLIGIIVIFFISHQRVWVSVEQEPDGVKIRVAGRSNRYNEASQRQLDDLCIKIEKGMTA